MERFPVEHGASKRTGEGCSGGNGPFWKIGKGMFFMIIFLMAINLCCIFLFYMIIKLL